MPNTQLNPDALDAAWDSLNGRVDPAYFRQGDLEVALQAYLAAAAQESTEPTDVDYHVTPQGHYDAWMDTREGYTQRKGWTLTCLWCQAEFTGATKTEALKGYEAHEEHMLQKLREADAKQAKNTPEVGNDGRA